MRAVSITACVLLALRVAAVNGPPEGQLRPADEPRQRGEPAVREAVAALLRAMDDQQRAAVQLPFDHPDRLRWRRDPAARPGVSMGELSQVQRARVHELLAAVLSPRGHDRVKAIMEEQDVLGRNEEGLGREYFWFAVYGQPESGGRWAWRFGGHHVSLHLTYEDDALMSVTPAFLGAEGAFGEGHPRGTGFNPLADRLRMALDFVGSLGPEQLARAVIAESPPDGLVRTEVARFEPGSAQGLPSTALVASQRAGLLDLIGEYTGDFAHELEGRELQRILLVAPDRLYFAWAGARDVAGRAHYYCIQGPDFVIEFQQRGGHYHTIWRRTDDFGG